MSETPINLVYLKYFCDAVRFESISKSARENFVSQSAISQGIQKLEQQLGHELVFHENNTFTPTKRGKTVFEHAQELFLSAENLKTALIEDKKEVSGTVEFACTHSFALALLPIFLSKIKRLFPKLEIRFRLAQAETIRELVKKGVVDFGFVLNKDDFSSFSCHEIYSGAYKLYYAPKYPILENQQFLVSEERIETALLKKAFKKHYKRDLPILMEIPSWEVIANFTEAGLGVGFFPDYLLFRRKQKLLEYPLEMSPIKYKILAILPRRARISHSVATLISSISDMLKTT